MMIFAVVGTLILVAIAVDIFYTVFTGKGGGWLTNAWTRSVWRGLLMVHCRTEVHRLLSVAGPLLLLGIVLIWYLAAVLGWTMIFASSDSAVMDSQRIPVVGLKEKLFFVGTTFSTVGYGNLLPNDAPWTFLGNLTALTGTVLLTAALSYVLAVLQTGIERRQLASMINSVGTSPAEFIERAWAGDDRGHIDDHILAIARGVSTHAEKHVNYPILQFFHSAAWRKAPAPAVLVFSDAIFLARHALHSQDRPALSLLHLCERSISDYLTQTYTTEDRLLHCAEHDFNNCADGIPRSLNPKQLRELGLKTIEDDVFREQLERYCERRESLIRLAVNDGWDPSCWPPEGSKMKETEQC